MNQKVRSKKTQKTEPGTIVEIPLPDGFHGYARILHNPLMAFYKVKTREPLNPDGITTLPIAFKIWVANAAVLSGRWPVIGHSPLEPENEVSPWFFKQDAISKELSLYQNGVERPASRDECLELERAAVWSAEHAESRLADQMDKRPNKWADSLRLKP